MIRRVVHSALITATVLCLTGSLRADPDITVKGQRLDRETARAQARDYVRRLGVAKGLTPASRWIDPVCLEVLGLDQRVADLVAQRFRGIARRAGARLATGRCRTNAVIAFTPDAANYVRKLEAFEPRQLEEASEARLAALHGASAPVRWWYRTGLRGAHDDAPSMTRPMGLQMSTEGGPSFDGGPAQDVIRLDSPSLISTGYKREIKSAAVVIDVNLASGTPLSAIGDYAALVLLAELDMPSDPPDRSILALFAPDAARPGGLTVQDEALLKALYALPMARDAQFHRGKLIGGMTKAALGGAE